MSWLFDTSTRRVLTAVLSGILFSLAQSLHPWWPAAWLAAAPLLAAAFSASRREACILAIVATFVGCASSTSFILEVAGPLVAFVIAPIGRSLGMVVAVVATRQAVLRWRHWSAIFIFPALMAGFDVLVATFSVNGSSGSLAYSQMNAIPLIQVASLAGAAGIVFVLNLFASALAITLSGRADWSHFHRGVTLAGIIVLASITFGFVRIVIAHQQPQEPVGIVVVDTVPGIKAASPDVAPWTVYKDAVAEAAHEGARIVVLPEKIAAFTPEQADSMRQALAEIADVNNVYLVVGITITAADHNENRAWLFDPRGKIQADYSKRHMVPGFEDAFVPGKLMTLKIIDGNPTGIAICKDMDFPELGREYGERDARLLLVPAWDFRRDGWQHSRMAVLRGVEDGYAIARAARDGVLTISDCYGRVLKETSSSVKPYSILVGKVPLGTGETIYARTRNTFGWFALILGVLLTVRASLSRPHPPDLSTGGGAAKS